MSIWTLIFAIFTVSTLVEAMPTHPDAVANCGRQLSGWTVSKTTDPDILIDQYLSEFDLETPSGVSQAMGFIQDRESEIQRRLDALGALPSMDRRREGGEMTITELENQRRQVSILMVMLKNAQSSFAGHRIEN